MIGLRQKPFDFLKEHAYNQCKKLRRDSGLLEQNDAHEAGLARAN